MASASPRGMPPSKFKTRCAPRIFIAQSSLQRAEWRGPEDVMSAVDPEALQLHPEDDFERPSLARSSAIRLMSSASFLVLAFVTSVVTARWLGPSNKGTLSALS